MPAMSSPIPRPWIQSAAWPKRACDHHNNLRQRIKQTTSEIDKPIAGLLQDLHDRGMLQDTLVVWGGEFGRTTNGQNGDGRNHNNRGFTMWMAGAGVKGGTRYGACDPVSGSACTLRSCT